MNTVLKEILNWYNENGVLDFVNDEPVNHFKLSEKENLKLKQKEQRLETNSDNFKSKSLDEIVKLLALKHKAKKNGMQTDENILTPENAIRLARETCERIEKLEDLAKAVENFEGCYSIKKLATNTVFGEGNKNSDILIIGEAPGNNEDLQGRPFCGQSGMLMDKMFKAIGYKREDLYITNTLFWRPPGNRTPTLEEVEMCRPFVEKHIALINPKIIIMMGATALKALTNTFEGITRARRKFFDYNNQYLTKPIKATALFHPSYLLRSPIKKRDTWQDLLIIKNFLNSLL